MGVVPLLQGGQRLLQVGDKGLGALQAAVDADDALVPPELCALFRTEPRVGDEDQALEPAPPILKSFSRSTTLTASPVVP